MATNQPAVVSFKESYPIGFSLRNVDQQSVLYIDDIGDALDLEITNTYGGPLTIPGQSNPFELCFRPGTLSEHPDIKLIKAPPGWTMDAPTKQADGTVSLSFRNAAQVIFAPESPLRLTLGNVVPSARGGSHGTRVELRYHDLKSEGNSDVKGVRVQHMTIINRQGRKHIPLHVGFVDSNKILNNGTANTLTLRITNTMKFDGDHPERSVVTLRGSARGSADPENSRLNFSFVAGEKESIYWALGTVDQVGAIIVNETNETQDAASPDTPYQTSGVISVMSESQGSNEVQQPAALIRIGRVERRDGTPPLRPADNGLPVSAYERVQEPGDASGETAPVVLASVPSPNGNPTEKTCSVQQETGWIKRADNQGETPEWVLTPTETIQLKAEEYIEFTFSNIMTTHSGGYTHLYVHYQNIPGYWDGQFICPVEKVPVIFTRDELKVDKLEANEVIGGVGQAKDGADMMHVSQPIKGPEDRRNYFKDREKSDGLGLRVGAAWGMYGIYAESGTVVVGGDQGVNLQNGRVTIVSGRNRIEINDNLYVTGGIACESGYWSKLDGCWQKLKHRTDLACWLWEINNPSFSDRRFKGKVVSIQDALAKVIRLSGITYEWNEEGLKHFTRDIEENFSAGPGTSEAKNRKVWDEERKKRIEQLSGQQIGLIAQDVEPIVPELVQTDSEGYKSIDYGRLTVLLVEAIKEQQALIERLSERVATLEGKVA